MLKYLVFEKMLPHLCAVAPCCAGQHWVCILSLVQLSLALPGGLRKEFGNVDSPITSGFQKNRLKLPFSPDLVHMEEKPSAYLLGKHQQEEQQVVMSLHVYIWK